MKKKDYYLKQKMFVNFCVGIVILVFAIFWNMYFSNKLKEKEEFLKHSEKTIATITDIEYRSEIDREEIRKVYIQYYINGNVYTGTLNEMSKNMYVGQVVEIFYDINNPSVFIQNNKFTNNVFKYLGYAFFIIGIMQIVRSIKDIILYISTKKAKEIKAKVQRVIEKGNGVYKVYVIECNWTDEKGEQYIFYSKPYKEPYFIQEFEKMNIKELPVRVKNKMQYIVITEKIDKKLSV